MDDQADWVPDASPATAEQDLSIGNRLADWKTIVSFVFAIGLIVLVAIKGNIDPHALWLRLRGLNLPVFFLAFLVYYATFPIRGYRWKVLLQNAYRGTHSEVVDNMSIRGLTEILYISWFVNCVVPAKLGDLYRAYLAKLWAQISWLKTVGTIMAERLVDILVLSVLLAITALIVFHDRLGHVGIVLVLGCGLAVVAAGLLVAMKTMSAHIRILIPTRFRDRYISFEEGTLNSLQRLPLLLALTIVIWFLEGVRYQLVFTSLGLHSGGISPIPFAPMLFFALATAVLTTVPFTPGGLGLVEVVLLTLMSYLGLHKADAAAIILVDRVLSYYSIAILGFVVYLVSKRSHFRHAV